MDLERREWARAGHCELADIAVEPPSKRSEHSSDEEGCRTEPLQAPRRADPEEMQHQQSEVSRCGGEEITLLHVLSTAQPAASLIPAPAHVREAPLHSLGAEPLQCSPPSASDSTTVGVKRFSPSLRLVRPATSCVI